MTNADNDNEPLTFQSLGLAAAIVLNRIRNAQALRELTSEDERDKIVDTDSEKSEQRPAHQPTDQERADIERRIRDILAMENRLRRKSRI